jgi:serine/threonine protein kinase
MIKPLRMVGRTIGHYTVLEKLGEGGMGVVYKAQDTQLHRSVAIRCFPVPSRMMHTGAASYEKRAASSLNHPNIVTIYETSAIDGVHFIAMEYVEGRPLSQLIPQKGCLSEQLFRMQRRLRRHLQPLTTRVPYIVT